MHAESWQRHNIDKRPSSLENYTSHFIWKGLKGLLKVLLCERLVGGWIELQHMDPHSYGHNSVSFPFSWAVQLGTWGPSLSGTGSSFQHLLSNCNWTSTAQSGAWGPPLLGGGFLYCIFSSTDWTSCALSYIIVRRPPSSCGHHKSHSFNPDAPVIYTGAFAILTAWPGSVCYSTVWGTTLYLLG